MDIRDIVDDNDNVISSADKKELREKNLTHRGVVIFVFNSAGQIFVHKRVADKDIYPSVYDAAFGGGVDLGEDYDEAAKRELLEESGIKDVELKYHFKTRYTSDINDSFAKVYSCVYDGEIILQKEEIEKGFFVTLEELEKMMKEKEFAPDTSEIFKEYVEMQKNQS